VFDVTWEELNWSPVNPKTLELIASAATTDEVFIPMDWDNEHNLADLKKNCLYEDVSMRALLKAIRGRMTKLRGMNITQFESDCVQRYWTYIQKHKIKNVYIQHRPNFYDVLMNRLQSDQKGSWNYQAISHIFVSDNVDVRHYDEILFSVNVGNRHWIAVVVDIKNKELIAYDSMGKEGKGKDAYRRDILKNFGRWLDEEAKMLTGLNYSIYEAQNTFTYRSENRPAQTNNYDCGPYTLMYIKSRASNTKMTYTAQDMQGVRHRLAYELAILRAMIL
jgi:hypothetical protein